MGIHKQHDAEEFQSVVMSALAAELTSPTESITELRRVTGLDAPPNVFDTLFGLEMDVDMVCKESPEEPVVTIREGHRKLSANIDGGAGKTVQVNHLHEAILLALSGDLEKRSDVLGRNAVWTRTARISRLPKYIAVHLLR
jgi:ubiquitin carboxyl-terminal hydrolase 14